MFQLCASTVVKMQVQLFGAICPLLTMATAQGSAFWRHLPALDYGNCPRFFCLQCRARRCTLDMVFKRELTPGGKPLR
ncbi:hypothetical protein Pelo_9579 [Pelomyxa schiedti]|nr:hypothetical protein Pelo_9579 [Pelomyxa schiedti]